MTAQKLLDRWTSVREAQIVRTHRRAVALANRFREQQLEILEELERAGVPRIRVFSSVEGFALCYRGMEIRFENRLGRIEGDVRRISRGTAEERLARHTEYFLRRRDTLRAEFCKLFQYRRFRFAGPPRETIGKVLALARSSRGNGR